MVELVVYRGLPASGKTTLARAWVAEDVAGRARVNRDDLRGMLHDGVYQGHDTERHVSGARDRLIDQLLRAGVSVASDDTNLSQDVARRIALIGRSAGAEVRVVDLTGVSFDECLRRDQMRERPVGAQVIIGMHQKYLAGGRSLRPLDEPQQEEDPYVYVPDEQMPMAWMVDLDGTLALMEGRSPFEWHRVGEDKLNNPVRAVAHALQGMGYHLVFLSGRDAVCRAETERWITEVAGFPLGRHWRTELFMRPEGDTRKDSVVKLEIFREQVAHRYRVRGVLDDRPSVCRMWRRIGLSVFQVGDPDVEF